MGVLFSDLDKVNIVNAFGRDGAPGVAPRGADV
jgi:hypothetical protein